MQELEYEQPEKKPEIKELMASKDGLLLGVGLGLDADDGADAGGTDRRHATHVDDGTRPAALEGFGDFLDQGQALVGSELAMQPYDLDPGVIFDADGHLHVGTSGLSVLPRLEGPLGRPCPDMAIDRQFPGPPQCPHNRCGQIGSGRADSLAWWVFLLPNVSCVPLCVDPGDQAAGEL